MKAIKLVTTKIEIPFLDKDGKEALKLYFDRSDENVERLEASFDGLKERAEKQQNSKEEESLASTREFLKDTTDSMLGEGSFDLIYELTPSLHIIAVYLYQIAIGIKEELESEQLEALEEKYLS
ncbi:hypothetical protein [uncultured Vagococcus sp.]|uniref:hypothetical protein n=1 Tax=uncultured Vagococcus sp. TaxID=189676 RepID=UPI002590BB0E|nr:hypothetical protein [uncultured Vagococcus sp.]